VSKTTITPRYVSLKQAGVYASCSPWTIQRAIANGTLPFSNALGDRKVDLNDLDALFASSKTTL
jgi:hypothetical protein